MRIRRMCVEDLKQVTAIEQEIFSQPWTEEGFAAAIDRVENLYLVAEEGEEILGYCGIYITYEAGEIPNVAVKPEHQNQGIAGELLQQLIRQAEGRGVNSITLEVRVGNEPARHLYQKSGFEDAGIRKDFYQQPREDAMVMVREKAYYCNCCGRKILPQNGILKEEICKVEKEWGYFSNKDGEIHRFTICESCYDKWVAGFAIPPEVTQVTVLM